MKKILFSATITDHFYYFHLPYLEFFHNSGWEVHTAGLGSRKLPNADCQHEIPISRSPLSPGNISAFKKLRKIIKDNQFDIIHAHTPMGGILTRLAAVGRGAKVIYTAHGFHFYKGAPILNWLCYYPVEKLISLITDCLITINEEDYQFALMHFKHPQVKSVHGVGYNDDRFFKNRAIKSAVRKKNGFKDDDIIILYVAELNANKNQGLTLTAAADIIKKNKNVKIVFAGADNYGGKYQSLAGELGIEKNVFFLSHREDVDELYNMSDIYAASSIREGLPVNVMEAMACALPVLALDNRGHRALIKDGESGILVQPGDVNRMKTELKALVDSPDLRFSLGDAAAEKIKRFSKSAVTTEMCEIYKEFMR